MKVLSVFGITKSGKTTTIENIISRLSKKYSVGSVKEIHFESFKIDTEGTNTDRHRRAGSQLITARGIHETDVLYQDKLSIDKILSFYDQEYVILEGVTDIVSPKIITAHSIEEIEERLDDSVFAISGVISNQISEYKGIPVINSITDGDKLISLIEEKVFERLPGFSEKCCTACGMSCKELCGKILKGEASRSRCLLPKKSISLKVNGEEIEMVPFVQRILKNSVEAVVKELNGYKENSKIEVIIK